MIDAARSFLQALNNYYISGFYLDLKEEKYYTFSRESKGQVQTADDWSGIDDYIKRYIHPDDQAKLTEYSRPSYIRERLKREPEFSIEVRDFGTGEERCFRYTTVRGVDDDHAAICIIDVTELMRKREELEKVNIQLEENQAQLEESSAEQEAQLAEITALNDQLRDTDEKITKAYNIASTLSSSYENIYLVDMQARTLEIIKQNAYLIRGMVTRLNGVYPYDQVVNAYIQHRFRDEDKAYITKCFDWDTAIGQLQEKGTYDFNYQTHEDGRLREWQARYRKMDERYAVAGFQNIEETLRQEKKRNEELRAAQQAAEEERRKLADAYGMIQGFSQEYHTIWLVDKETSKMRLIRSNGKTTIKRAVQMGIDLPAFDTGFATYIETCVEPEDRERMHREIAFAEVLRQLEEHPDTMYAVNYLRRDDSGHVGYHQIAFANADTEDGKKQFVYGFRDVDKMVKEEQAQKEELRKAKEDAEAANQAKTTFLFNMSHDIRTPMNAIMGFRDLLEKHQDDPQRRADYLRKIDDSSQVLLSIINNVLEMARIERGTIEIDETAWSAEQFNDTLYSVFNEMMKQKGLNFTRQIVVKNNYVYCDPIKLREIFINLLSNAYKYTHSGGSVNMHLEEIPSPREGWALYQTTITDTGIGMSEEFLPHIFDEFAREHNSTEIKVEGTGLGMPIVKRLVDMLDGTIEVKSEKGKGTTFIVTLPHRIAQKSDLVDHAGIELDPKLFEGKHILLAEDNELNAEIAIEILGEAGFLIDHAHDGVECCQMLKEAPAHYYDVILMDVQMPNMNGYLATRAIRIMDDTEKANIPILAMTANAFEEDKREAMRAGMNGHIAKPINIKQLMRELATTLA